MNKGFTLLELSIVLVIIGLIIGGITVGADMIRSAELNNVVSDINKYKTALNTFKLKYNALPGDIKNASSYWPDAIACPTSTAPLGCNGNGDGIIQAWDSTNVESYRLFQHLGFSGIVSGNYSGSSNTAPFSPSLKITNSRILIQYRNSMGINKNMMEIAGDRGTILPDAVLFTPAEAYQIDSKIDDGTPSRGKIFSWGGNNGSAYSTNCFTGTNAYTGPADTIREYNLALESIECRLLVTTN